jgi:hypothetical protein
MSVEISVVLKMEEAPAHAGDHRRIKRARSSEFAISLRQDINAVKSPRHLCIHDDLNQSSREEEMTTNRIPDVNRLSFQSVSVMF